jgi:transposase
MSISDEMRAKILRYYHVERWRKNTIARQLGVHHTTIERVLAETGIPKLELVAESMLEPFLPFIVDTFVRFPKLTARRMYDMVCERGYPGGVDHFRHLMSLYRPKPAAEAYLRLRTLPGEQAQVDWGHFGHVIIGRAKRPVMGFVVTLSFSRKRFIRFYLNARMENFIHGHESALIYFGGVPRVMLYDNLRSLVLERQGDTIRFNSTMLELSTHYRYEARPVARARGNEKGRVERTIRFVRDNFWAAREWRDIDDLNSQAMDWCNGAASRRPCPEQPARTVQSVFEEEQPSLSSLPVNPFGSDVREEVRIGKTPYARFDLNDYSVPYTYVRQTLTVAATIDTVTILSGIEVIAQHARSYDKGAQIEDEAHIQALIARKKQASQHSGQNRLTHALPISASILKMAAERGFNMGQVTMRLLQLLTDYGVTEMTAALLEAVSKKAPHPNAIRFILEQRRETRNQLPLVKLDLPHDDRITDLVVIPHKLTSYDQLSITTTMEIENDQQ